jgi:hypothetical protein
MAYAQIRPGGRVSLERPLAGPHLSFDLAQEIGRLRREPMAHELEVLDESAFLLCLSWPGPG